MSGYPYASGDLLVDRHSYSYSAFGGAAFLRDWARDRALVAAHLGRPVAAPAATPGCVPPAGAGFETDSLLEYLFAWAAGGCDPLGGQAREWLDLLVQRFEVTKRLHRAYGENHRAVDRELFRDYPLYVRFAEVLEAACRTAGSLPYLNALLKCLDTLCALHQRLPHDLHARVARLIEAERDLVAAVAARVEVAW